MTSNNNHQNNINNNHNNNNNNNNDNGAHQDSEIATFYRGKNVFITGATGFLGKLLVEKLLRSCPNIATIYILVRPKKGDTIDTRLDKIYDDVVYSVLRKEQPKFQHKIIPLNGDMALPNLGLIENDWKLLTDQIHIIYHIAATVRFHEHIKTATAINVNGTKQVITLAKQCQHLTSFVYVSTAFSNCIWQEIDEKFYDCPYDPDELIRLTEANTEQDLDVQTDKIIGKWPNTYTFTKAVAEWVVRNDGSNLPICICRPAIVMSTYKEPLKNWIDNFYGATGVVIGAGVGLLRVLHCHSDKLAELVPGDYVINNMIAASYKTAIEKKTKTATIPIYNYVSSSQNSLTWQNLMDLSQKYGHPVASIRAVWYYCLRLERHYIIYVLYAFFTQTIPAYLMDAALMIAGKKPMMVRAQKKIDYFSTIISYFCTQQWTFKNQNTLKLWNELSIADQKLFPFSMKLFDWDDYSRDHILGLRIYVVKDDISTLPEAKKKWMRFRIMHNGLKLIFYIIMFKLFVSLITYFYNIIF